MKAMLRPLTTTIRYRRRRRRRRRRPPSIAAARQLHRAKSITFLRLLIYLLTAPRNPYAQRLRKYFDLSESPQFSVKSGPLESRRHWRRIGKCTTKNQWPVVMENARLQTKEQIAVVVQDWKMRVKMFSETAWSINQSINQSIIVIK